MNRRLFIAGAGAGIMTMMLGGCNFMSKNEAQQKSVAQAATDSSTSTGNKNEQLVGTDKKILIAYFSHTGNTKAFAESIQRQVGGNFFAIEPQDAYPQNYDKVVQQAKGEVASKFRPKITNKIADIRAYDVIFIGTPIWWYTVAPPVRTFLAEYDLAGKTIVPFSTHKGSGLSGIDKAIQELQPQAKVLDGFAVWDNQAKDKQGEIANWLQRLKA